MGIRRVAGPWLRGLFPILTALVLTAQARTAASQETQAPEETIAIFFDCQAGGCFDLDYFRREVPFVNWVRNREDGDVHVLVTSRRTGGGGQEYTLAFIGLGSFEGRDQELVASTSGDATEDDRRRTIAQRLRLGLVPYLAERPVAERLRVTLPLAPGGPGEPSVSSPGDDPWDFWVFRISGNGFINGQSTTRFANYFGRVSANRTTEAWKIDLGASFSENVQEFLDLPDGEGGTYDVKETRQDWGVNGFLVRSVGARWALGLRADAGSSNFVNQDFRWSLRPGVEFNLFPYAESSRRSFTLQYLVGPLHWDYEEETIFGKTSETRVQQSLTAALALIQPWGRWSTSLTGAHYLHDTSKYRVTLSGNLNVRVFKGFSVRVGGNYSWIRDQLFLPAGGATSEEILTRQRQIATNFRYFTSFGIEYRFGSIFNNVVNPRFGGGGGENIMIMF